MAAESPRALSPQGEPGEGCLPSGLGLLAAGRHRPSSIFIHLWGPAWLFLLSLHSFHQDVSPS